LEYCFVIFFHIGFFFIASYGREAQGVMCSDGDQEGVDLVFDLLIR